MSQRRTTPSILFVLLGAAATLAGCSDDVRLEDDLYPDTGRRPADGDGDVLNGPYAAGSTFGLRVAGIDEDECSDVELASDDGAVLGLERDEEDPCRSIARATGPGHTTLRVLDGDDQLHAVDVEVATATSATLHPRALLAAGLPEASTAWDTARVVIGTTATFTVRWWADDGRELSAHELLVPTSDESLGLGAAPGHGRNVDALQITPTIAGTFTAEAGTTDARMAQIEIEAVEPEVVAELTVVSGEVPGEDDRSAILAIGRDADGDAVLGLQPTWTVDGTDVRNDDGNLVEGDLFLFHDGGDERHVVATIDGHSVASDVPIDGEGSVESSNGCQGVPGLPAPASALALSGAIVLARLARRRRTPS